ncbi:MAG: kelch repeat-containing protein [Planctomycetota bacterium]
MSRTTATAIAATALLAAAASQAQHFAKPDPINPATVGRIGEPLFTIPRPTTSFGSAVSGGWLYVLGGYTGRPHDYYGEAQSSDFYRINLLDHTHHEALPNLGGIQSCPLEAWDGGIVRTGGMVALNTQGEDERLSSLNTVAWYDSVAREWNDLPALPKGRSSHDTAVVGTTLFVLGGWSMDAESGDRTWFSTVETLDLASENPAWQSFDAPFERRALTTVALGDQIVAIGGITPAGRTSKQVDIFNITTGQWTTGPDFPDSAFGAAAEVSMGRVFASGSAGRVHSWAPGESEWSYEGTLTFPRFFHQIAADHDGDLLFAGGISQGVRPVHVERMMLSTEHRAAMVQHWTLPSPASSKNRQGMFIENGWLALFGGNNSTGQHDFEPDNFLTEGHMLSLAGMTWKPMTDLPRPRQTIQTVARPDGSGVFAFGGFAHDGDVARGWSDGFVYDYRSGDWTSVGEVLPAPRSQFQLASHGDRYWIFGGLDYDPKREQGDQFRHLLPVLSADATSDTPVFEPTGIDLPRKRRAAGGVVFDDRFYLVGGMTDNFQIVDACDVFDFETGSFSTIPAPARPRLSPTLVELGGKLYLAGGSSPKPDGSGFEANPSIEVFDPKAETWSTLVGEIPVTPRHLRVTTFRGRLLLVSTHEDRADLIHLVLIDPRLAPGAETPIAAAAHLDQ